MSETRQIHFYIPQGNDTRFDGTITFAFSDFAQKLDTIVYDYKSKGLHPRAVKMRGGGYDLELYKVRYLTAPLKRHKHCYGVIIFEGEADAT